jgi:hypothetical protein
MKLKPGTRLRSQVDTTEIIVVRSGAGEAVVVACGAAAVPSPRPPRPPVIAAWPAATRVARGKRVSSRCCRSSG